ncbi:glycosyl transferase [Mycobacteroides abscessus subsp. abscessus]|nr:glycosyl transferase [Mycobacteroides abscessus subsp. abscessus]
MTTSDEQAQHAAPQQERLPDGFAVQVDRRVRVLDEGSVPARSAGPATVT